MLCRHHHHHAYQIVFLLLSVMPQAKKCPQKNVWLKCLKAIVLLRCDVMQKSSYIYISITRTHTIFFQEIYNKIDWHWKARENPYFCSHWKNQDELPFILFYIKFKIFFCLFLSFKKDSITFTHKIDWDEKVLL